MLSFDEFRAVNNREKIRSAQKSSEEGEVAKKQASKIKKATKKVPDDSTVPNAAESGASPAPKKSLISRSIDSVGEFLEVHQMQSLYVFLIVLDTFVSLAEMYLSCPTNFYNDTSSINRKVMVRLLNSFSTFTTLFFTAEIVAVVMVFGTAMFTHWGYILDLLTTGGQIYLEQKGYGKVSRILNILRFWRLVRLLNSMVSAEKDAHDRTVRLLETSELEVKKLQVETTSLRTEIVREKEARDAIEDMLQNYKEEVDTLNEALKIAAMDIAEVAQTEDDFALSEEGDGDDSQDESLDDADHSHAHQRTYARKAGKGGAAGEEAEFVDAAPSRYSKAGNKSNVMRAVMEDSSSVQSRGSTLTAASHNYGASTFLVHEDGTYEQK